MPARTTRPAAGTTDSGAPSSVPPPADPSAPLLSNDDLARIFHEIGDLLEIKGELVFKTVAYHRAADTIGHSPVAVARAYRDGTPPRLPGVGAAISDKLTELALTGHLAFLDRLRIEVPPSLLEILRLPGVGPRTARQLYEELGIETVEDLRHAAEAGHLRGMKGISAKTEQSILLGIAALANRSDRLLLGAADAAFVAVMDELHDTPGLRALVPAGSFRRRRETIGDLDLLAATTEAETLVSRFAEIPAVERVLNRGHYKAAVKLVAGPQVDLMLMPPGEEGTYLIHFTGSKEHNVRLRAMARDQGWSLSEKGFLRLGSDGEPATGAAAELRTFASEGDAYAFLGLPFIAPELREDRGEIEAALAGRLPDLVDLGDLQGDCHTHSNWSDGVHEIAQMADACRARGYAYQVLTDHSFSLAIARGLTVERVGLQRAVIAELNARYTREAGEGLAPDGAAPTGFRVLHGCELEIRADGRLDFDDEVLAAFDVVVASLHVSRRQPRDQLTRRVLTAIHSPHVDVIAHPAGRMIGEGARDSLDLDWDAIYEAAARTGTALEINGSDHRVDLDDEHARRAIDAGCLVTIDSDAHRTEELDYVRWGVGTARRGWVEKSRVLNARPVADLLAWVDAKGDRLAAG